MTTATISTFEPDGRAIAYIDEGAGPALVLIPETGQDIASLGTLPVGVTINAGGQLPAGTYVAHIVVRGGAKFMGGEISHVE